ncbi:hypothetical protein PMAYCL1PPCAC_26180, partial [Pristionchus mayeri]
LIPFATVMIVTTTLFRIAPEMRINLNPAEVCNLIMSFHATTHCVALIVTTPAFKRTLFRVLPYTSNDQASYRVPHSPTIHNPQGFGKV